MRGILLPGKLSVLKVYSIYFTRRYIFPSKTLTEGSIISLEEIYREGYSFTGINDPRYTGFLAYIHGL